MKSTVLGIMVNLGLAVIKCSAGLPGNSYPQPPGRLQLDGLFGGLPGIKHWLDFDSRNFLYFVREPGHFELCRAPRLDLYEHRFVRHHVFKKALVSLRRIKCGAFRRWTDRSICLGGVRP